MRFTAAALLKDDLLALSLEYDLTGRSLIEVRPMMSFLTFQSSTIEGVSTDVQWTTSFLTSFLDSPDHRS